ncbi:MAG: M18 family aminopeptidase [Clostridiales bacterium]|nr:M18 family aminopeptidase [Clostridiales bacterium]
MDHISLSSELLGFIKNSPSMFHSVENIKTYMQSAGFEHISESDRWELKKGGRYFTTRNGSSIIAFSIGDDAEAGCGYRLCASHSDSPAYKVKAVPELEGPDGYLRLDVESYGGMIDSSWFDRPLAIAGRVMIRENDSSIKTRLIHIDRDLLLIPNVAIHFNRDINSGYKYNRQIDLCPMFSAGKMEKGSFDRMIADELGVDTEDILGKDLFLVNRQEAVLWGYEKEFISAPKLDDLQCAFASMKAFLDSNNRNTVNIYCCFDNEEVGSNTKQGAMSTFLPDVMRRISAGLGGSEEDWYRTVSSSFMVSCDNAHAVHPNHPEKSDQVNRVYMNRGIVIKESANQKYTTDAFSRSLMTELCRMADAPVQHFANRSDSAGGSTLGNLSNIQVSMHAVDIGLPQLAMHSSFETAGSRDTEYMTKALRYFYEAGFSIEDGKIKIDQSCGD